MAWMGLLIPGMLGAGAIGALGSMGAASTQAGAQEQAAATQQQMFNTINAQEQPFIQGGYSALNSLLYGLGENPVATPGPTTSFGGASPSIAPSAPSAAMPSLSTGVPGTMFPGGPPSSFGGASIAGMPGVSASEAHSLGAPTGSYFSTGPTSPSPSFNPATSAGGLSQGSLIAPFSPTQTELNNYPGYQFALQTGGQAVRNADTPGVGALSGAALKDLTNFDVGTANTFYNQYFNQYQQQQNNIFSRLSAIAGLGQSAATQTGNTGAQLGTGIAQAQAAAGGSTAAGMVGATNSVSGSIPLAYILSAQQAMATANNPYSAAAYAPPGGVGPMPAGYGS